MCLLCDRVLYTYTEYSIIKEESRGITEYLFIYYMFV